MIETNEVTLHARLVNEVKDLLGYTTYVFENLEGINSDFHYIMCVRFPNWDSHAFQIDDVGYVSLRFIQAGVDKWFDGKDFVPYNYTNVQFLKFVPEPVNHTNTLLVVD